MSLTWVDGVAADTVPADDRGLNYADGAFETLSCHEGCIQHEDLHRTRLTRALSALGVTSAAEHSERLFEEAGRCLETAGHTGVARLTVTRGSGPRGYAPPAPLSCGIFCARLPDRTRRSPHCVAVLRRPAGQRSHNLQVSSCWHVLNRCWPPLRRLRVVGMTC